MAETAAGRATRTGKKIRRTLLGRKVGMTQIFDENGVWVPVTVLEAGPCVVLQVKTAEKDGYTAIQVGFGATKKKPRKPQAGLFTKAGTDPVKWVREVPFVEPSSVIGAAEGATEVKLGDKIGV